MAQACCFRYLRSWGRRIISSKPTWTPGKFQKQPGQGREILWGVEEALSECVRNEVLSKCVLVTWAVPCQEPHGLRPLTMAKPFLGQTSELAKHSFKKKNQQSHKSVRDCYWYFSFDTQTDRSIRIISNSSQNLISSCSYRSIPGHLLSRFGGVCVASWSPGPS